MTSARNRVSQRPRNAPHGGKPSRRLSPCRQIKVESRLAKESPPRIVRSRRPRLAADETVATAFSKIMAKAKTQVTGNIPAAVDGNNPDGVHQLRVGLRRIRSVLYLFRFCLKDEAKGLDREAQHVLKVLGTARDLDVFVTQTLPQILRDPPNDAGLLALRSIAEVRREIAYENVRLLLKSERMTLLVDEFSDPSNTIRFVTEQTDGPLSKVATRLLNERHKKVLKLGHQFETLSTPQRHRVRIAVKKLRYACDYFQSLYPADESRRYLKSLKSLQDDLGQLNDSAVAIDLANQLAAYELSAQSGADLVVDWYKSSLVAREPHMVAAWQQFQKAQPFWQ